MLKQAASRYFVSLSALLSLTAGAFYATSGSAQATAVLDGFQLQTSPNTLTVVLNISEPTEFTTEVTSSGRVLVLQNTKLSDRWKASGPPIVVDNNNRVIAQSIGYGQNTVKILLPSLDKHSFALSVLEQPPGSVQAETVTLRPRWHHASPNHNAMAAMLAYLSPSAKTAPRQTQSIASRTPGHTPSQAPSRKIVTRTVTRTTTTVSRKLPEVMVAKPPVAQKAVAHPVPDEPFLMLGTEEVPPSEVGAKTQPRAKFYEPPKQAMTDSVVRFNPDALAQDAKQEKNIMKSVAEDAVAASAISEAPVLEAQPKSQSPTLQASEKPASQSWFRLPFELPSFPWSKRLMVIVGGLFAIVGITALLFVRRFVRYLNSLGGGLPTPSTKPNQPRIIQEPSPAESVAPMQPRIEDKPMVSADAYLWPVAGTGTDGMSKPHEMRIQNKASAKSHFGRMLQAI